MARITVAAPVTASPAGKNPRTRGRARFIGHQTAPAVGFQSGRGGGQQRIGRGAERHDYDVARDLEIRALLHHGGAASALIRLAEGHFHAAQPLHPPLFVAQHGGRVGEHPEADALLPGVVHLLGAAGSSFSLRR